MLADGVSQPPLPQHPLGHELGSQTQTPVAASHSRPEAQGRQVAPALPQELLVCDPQSTQVPFAPPLQHPFGHELASHTHCPEVLSHSRWVPHASHEAPLDPQEALLSLASVSQVEPVQHPVQALPPQLQTPVEHACPPAQGEHVAPPVPHEVVPCDA